LEKVKMEGKRVIAAAMGNGHIGLVEQDIPALKAGAVLVEVHNSLVSPGTELGGWAALKEQLDNPKKDAKPTPFGYSNAGVVVDVGEGVAEFAPGDRVACIGAGYALHSNYVVIPHNLCIALPQNVSFAQGSYAMLAATALQAVRRGDPKFGEFAAVLGLGIVGQLTARLLQLSGNYVIGWDTIAFRNDIAKKWGIDATAHVGAEDAIALTKEFTGSRGLDMSVFAFGGNAEKAYESTFETHKCTPDGHRMGRIVVVGGAAFTVQWASANFDVRIAARTGPGYHDEAWEYGSDYPPVFMRWTTRSNLELLMRLIAEGKLDVDLLTTHRIELENVDAGISAIIDAPEKILGVVFEMKH
jgi:threonine dehydrogenase-like Zn-dependent dehydrogenase